LKVRPLTLAPPPFVLGAASRKEAQSAAVDKFIAAARRATSVKRFD